MPNSLKITDYFNCLECWKKWKSSILQIHDYFCWKKVLRKKLGDGIRTHDLMVVTHYVIINWFFTQFLISFLFVKKKWIVECKKKNPDMQTISQTFYIKRAKLWLRIQKCVFEEAISPSICYIFDNKLVKLAAFPIRKCSKFWSLKFCHFSTILVGILKVHVF